MKDDRITLESENFFSFSQGKIGLLSSKKMETISLTPSPKKIFNEETNFPEYEFSTGSQSTSPTATTFSMSSKSNILVSHEIMKTSCRTQPIEIHRKKIIDMDVPDNKRHLAKSAKNFPDHNKSEELNQLIHSQKKSKLFRQDEEKVINEFYLDSKAANEADLKALTNTQDIRDFHDYTKECIQDMKRVVLKGIQPPKVLLDDLHLKQINEGLKRLAIFDLDETLIHREVENLSDCDEIIEVKMPNKTVAKIGINIRPLLTESLMKIRESYILVLFTASQQIYADKVLQLIDPKNEFFVKRLYRDSCKIGNIDKEQIYIKDLDIFSGVPLEKTVIIDNSVLSFCRQLYNGIPILPYYDNKEDTELQDLVGYLDYLKNCEDVRVENKNIIGLKNHHDPSDFDSSSDEEEFTLVAEKAEDPQLYCTNSSVESNLGKSNNYLSYNTNSSFSELSDYKTNKQQTDRHQELFRCLEIYKKKYQKLKMKESEKV